MKILFLAYEFPSDLKEAIVSGEVKNPFTLARGLSAQGHELQIVSVPFLSKKYSSIGQRETLAGPAVDVPEGRGWGVLRYLWRSWNVAKWLKDDKNTYDIIHASAPALALSVIFARQLNRRLRSVPIITTGHGTNLPEADADANAQTGLRQKLRAWNARLVLPIDCYAFRRSDRVVSVSEFQNQELQRHYRVNPKRIDTIYNGVDLDHYGMAAKRPSVDRIVLLFVGRLVPKKGVQHILKAMPRIREVAPKAVLRVIGGTPEFDSYGPELRQLAAELGIEESVEWVSGVAETILPLEYASASVGIFPSEGYESLPTVVLESMASGLPVIATRSWGTPEALGSDHRGLLSTNDPDTIADAVVVLTSDSEQRANAIRSQFANISKFSLEECIRRHLEVYKLALESK